jgi:uncharacterized protein
MRARQLGLVAIGCAALAGVATGLLPRGGAAQAASFDCARAATPSEIAICANPTLSALDGQLGLAYAQRVAMEPALRQIERGWILVRNVGCGHSVGCLASVTRWQLAFLRSGAAQPPAALPRAVGACSLTRIAQVGTRLDGAPGSGSAVNEVNQAYQVSYDQIPAIDRSRPGDPALVCLISLPQHCPPGDDRGRIYGVANLRTLGAWAEPDSEHSCGGA